MKRYILLPLVCLVLAAALLITGSHALNSVEDTAPQTVTACRGDASAARGLTLGTTLTFNENLLWQTHRQVAAGTEQTEFSFHPYRIAQNFSSYEAPPYQMVFQLCNSTDENDPLCAALAAQDRGDGITRRVFLRDYYDSYPLYLGRCFFDTGTPLMTITDNDWLDFGAAFTPLRIPVAEEDVAEVYYYQEGSTAYSRHVDSYFSLISHRFTPFTLMHGNDILTTVGFAPDAEPRAEWAPEGFGVWLVPVNTEVRTSRAGGSYEVSTIRPEQARVVYPLDIETQSVLAFGWDAAEASLLLVTAENGEAVLRVLDGTTYQVRCTVPLGAVETAESYTSFMGDTGEEYEIHKIDYPLVRLRTAEDFLVIAIGRRLAVLEPGDEGYRMDFSCDLIDLCSSYAGTDHLIYFWSDDLSSVNRYSDNCVEYDPVTRNNYRCDFT